MVRFDYYAATTQSATPEQLIALFGIDAQGGQVREVPGTRRFGRRLVVTRACGVEIGSVQWGGSGGSTAMLEVYGDLAPFVVEQLRSSFPHRVARVDSCADFDSPGAFARLLRAVRSLKRRRNLVGEKRGDWDRPEFGRTQTIGSTKSVTMLRLYEKGKHPDYRHLQREHWARLELQVRPKGTAKSAYSELDPLQVWGATPWSRELCEQLLRSHVDPHPAGTTYRRSDEDRKLYWMCKQYRNLLLALHQESGSWDLVGRNIGAVLRADTRLPES